MNASRTNKVEIFNAAAELQDPVARASFLAEACGDNEQLRLEIEDLLQHDEQVGSFLQAPLLNPNLTLGSQADANEGRAESDRGALPLQETVGPAPLGQDTTLLSRDFGDYVLLEVVGHGGMGIVWKARQKSLPRTVAIKLIHSGFLTSSDGVEQFKREARATAKLDHPAIVPVYEAGECGGEHYLAMAFIPGASLAERIAEGPIPQRESAELVRQLAHAVAHAHSHDVIHRDLKPGNVLLREDGQPMIVDFGLAKLANADTRLTAANPGYTQLHGARASIRQDYRHF